MTNVLGRRRFLTMSAGAALAAGLGAARTPSRAAEVTNLTVGMSFHNLDAAPAWVAQDLRLFEKYGLNVTITSFEGGAKVAVAALSSGRLPMAFIAAASVINARAKGLPLEMIGGLIDKIPYDFVVAKDITSPSQLKGGKGAISGFGGSSDFISRFALAKLGVDPREVTFLQVGNETARLAALRSGQIQFTVLTAGLDLAAFDMGFKPMLRLYTLDQPYQHTGIGANATWAREHKDVVESFLKGLIAGSVYIKNPLNEAAVLALLRRHLRINEIELKKGFELYREQFYRSYPFVTGPGIEFILRARKIDMPATDFYDNSYVQALKDANFAATVGRTS